ncbi:hypothetical protein LSCM1_03518 [Leishmania martiniquensis]|uniref:Uncharacterized protein n=1 Tax=Leishmania martiniquensis TaxID=1580590 RepID=A0A836HEJ4_9TRYP|nr:hypothetical protein LSCM1_03518 [Leishmania martiniquensis]
MATEATARQSPWPPHLTRLVQLERVKSFHATLPFLSVAYGCQPLLSAAPQEVEEHSSSAALLANLAAKSHLVDSTEMVPAQLTAGTESGSQGLLAPKWGATRHDCGIELSMERVTVRQRRRR